MSWMNEYDVQEAAERYRKHPVLGPATRTLHNLVVWTNSNSDGWPYWKAPGQAAKKLEELIQFDSSGEPRFRSRDQDAHPDALKRALVPIKAFRTKHKADFEIVESLDDLEVVRTYTFVYAIEASSAEEAVERLEELIAQEGLGATPHLTVTERVKQHA